MQPQGVDAGAAETGFEALDGPEATQMMAALMAQLDMNNDDDDDGEGEEDDYDDDDYGEEDGHDGDTHP